MAQASLARPRDHAGVWVPPPLLYAGIFMLAIFLDRLLPLPDGPEELAGLVGHGLIVAGTLLSSWSGRCLQRSRTSLIPVRPTTALVVEGPYRFSRNPIYLGLVGVFLGVALVKQLLWAVLLAPVLLLVVTLLVTRKEEAYLEEKFGAEYRRYRMAVPRWL